MSSGLKKVAWHGMLVAMAIGAAALARVLALKPDPAMERVLNAPGVVALARDSWRARDDDAVASKPPLIAEAEAFALYLNPPAPAQERTPAPARPRTVRPQPKPVASAPKFKLVGISYYRSAPAESKALLWGPSDGYVWVKPGGQFGHLTIDAITRRSLICREAGQTREIPIDAQPAPAVMPVRRTPQRPPPVPIEPEVPGLAKAEPAPPGVEAEPVRLTTSQGRPRPRRSVRRPP